VADGISYCTFNFPFKPCDVTERIVVPLRFHQASYTTLNHGEEKDDEHVEHSGRSVQFVDLTALGYIGFDRASRMAVRIVKW
jgi:hypothetical protein